jgi:hypothetical protein
MGCEVVVWEVMKS